MKDFYLLERFIVTLVQSLMKKRFQNICDKPREELCGWLEMKRNYSIIIKKNNNLSGIIEK